jgi:lysyl endopeptidase
MNETTIQGFWHSRGLVMALVGLGMVQAAWGQAVWSVSTPDLEKAQTEMILQSEVTGREMVGTVLPVALDFFDAASRELVGTKEVWTLQVEAPGALATCVYFDDFHVPGGAKLWFETPQGRYPQAWVEGPVTSIENNDHRRWTNNEVPGDALVIRYEVPVGTVEPSALGICGVGFFARHQNFPDPWAVSARGGAEACQVDVNCPEGDSWECEKDAVVKLRITQAGGIFLCSGSMVNNTAQDCRQLMLSSFHCANDAEEEDWPFFKVQFNYEYYDCGGASSINSHTKTGVIHLTDSDDMTNGQINGSDFLLVEVEDPIDDSWEPFFAGWDATGFNGHGGVGIHHPSGDRKKISTYSNSLINSNVYAIGAHWRVTWVETETNHGVTEGGSSGSPIFEENHRILGTLSGGASFCNSPNSPDYYGKLSYHWDGANPIPVSMRLKAFLDPMDSGEEKMDGSYRQTDIDGNLSCNAFGACDATEVEERFLSGLSVMPNPTRGSLSLKVPEGFSIERIQWFDAMGRPLGETAGSAFQGQLDLSAWGSGVRYVTVTSSEGHSTTRKVVVQ